MQRQRTTATSSSLQLPPCLPGAVLRGLADRTTRAQHARHAPQGAEGTPASTLFSRLRSCCRAPPRAPLARRARVQRRAQPLAAGSCGRLRPGHMMMVPGSSTVSLISLCGSTIVPFRKTSSCAPARAAQQRRRPWQHRSGDAAEAGPPARTARLVTRAVRGRVGQRARFSSLGSGAVRPPRIAAPHSAWTAAGRSSGAGRSAARAP
jgi:hypothetical protein